VVFAVHALLVVDEFERGDSALVAVSFGVVVDEFEGILILVGCPFFGLGRAVAVRMWGLVGLALVFGNGVRWDLDCG
jgi:hypothetical protein